MSNVKELFFSEKNLDFTYGIVKQEVEKRCGYNIERQPMLKASYTKMALVVYEKTPSDDRNLVNLNNNLVDKSSTYFDKIIQEKKSKKQNNASSIDRPLSTQSQFDSESGLSILANNSDVNSTYDRMVQDRQRTNQGPSLDIMTREQISDNSISKSKSIQQYQQIVDSRDNRQECDDSSSNSNVLENIRQPQSSTDEYSVMPFTLSDDFTSMTQNVDQPLYQNMNMLNELDTRDPMKILDDYQLQRDNDFRNYQKMQDNTNASDFLNRENDIISSRTDRVSADPSMLFRKNEEVTRNMIASMTERDIGTNSGGLSSDLNESEKVISNAINKQIENKPQYIEKTHYVSVNSIDRDWTTQQENRYNFKVNFEPAEGQKGAGVNRLYKNIVSIEIMNIIMPLDNTPVPFDNRIYLSTLRHPYLLLHIEEIDGVYSGTNSNNNHVFSHLVFDKECSSKVLSTDFINSDVPPEPDTRFNKQFDRGFFRFCPSFFEKKSYYNNPLASLNRMTIKITDPYGNLISNESDVLEVSAITGVAIGDFELTATKGFPNTDSSGHKYIKITTRTHFYNKSFCIGDTIQFNSVSSDNTTLDNYLNRDEGHIIINLEAEDITSSAAAKNKSCINTIYIAPPGDMDTLNEALSGSTYIDASTATFTSFTGTSGNSIVGYLINKSNQAHLLFKIVTRDADTTNVIQSLNV